MDDLLSKVVVTIRSRFGREVDVTDNPEEREARIAAGRVVMSGAEVEALKGAPAQAVVMAMDLKKRFRGAEVESCGPSSGPYPWDEVELPRRKDDESYRKWWR